MTSNWFKKKKLGGGGVGWGWGGGGELKLKRSSFLRQNSRQDDLVSAVEDRDLCPITFTKHIDLETSRYGARTQMESNWSLGPPRRPKW